MSDRNAGHTARHRLGSAGGIEALVSLLGGQPDEQVQASFAIGNATNGSAQVPHVGNQQRLLAAGLSTPLPIQEQSFDAITKRRNVIIASATGSGKTLAFVIPLLATTRRHEPCQVRPCDELEVASARSLR